MLYAVAYPPFERSKKEEKLFGHDLAWRLLYHVMEREYGRKPSSLQVVYEPHGKPGFSECGLSFSLSHCAGFVCCALSDREIGVDAERLRPYDPRLARRICTSAELAFLEKSPERDRDLMTLWTLKESLMKAVGEGFHYGFQKAEFVWRQGGFCPVRKELHAVSLQPVPGVLVSACAFSPVPEKVELLDAKLLFREF